MTLAIGLWQPFASLVGLENLMLFDVQFTAYRINPETGEPYRWCHGPYSREEALAQAIKWGEYHKADAFTTVVPYKDKR